MVVMQLRRELRPSTHYSSYVKTRSRRQSATSVHYFSDHSDESIVGIPAEIMKQINPGSQPKSANGSVRSELSGEMTDMEGDNINVVIRVRPLSQKENKNNDEGIIQFPGEGQIWVDEGKEALKPFTFNVVFEPEATQEDVLEHSGMKRLIDMGIDVSQQQYFVMDKLEVVKPIL